MPNRINFVFHPGLPFEEEIQMKDEISGEPVDLTGCGIRMHVRDRKESEYTLIKLTTANQRIIIFSPLEGLYKLKLTSQETQSISRSGVHDIEISFPDGTLYPKEVEGEFNRVLTVTRDD